MNFFALAQSTTNGDNSLLSLVSPILMILMLVGIMFFMSKKQKKEDQKIQEMKDSLQIGDEITTIGGIVGRIVYINDETIVIETSKAGTRIRFLKTAVRSVDVSAAMKRGEVAPEAAKADKGAAKLEQAEIIEDKKPEDKAE